MAKPAVILVGADKGGVGKTTVARTLIDYFGAHQTPTRAFDTESPRGTLKRFHPELTEVVDVSSVSDQMKIFDTLGSADAKVTVIDVRAGLLSSTLQALTDIGFLESAKKGQITFAVFHILGPSIASLDEIAEKAREAEHRVDRVAVPIAHVREDGVVGAKDVARSVDEEDHEGVAPGARVTLPCRAASVTASSVAGGLRQPALNPIVQRARAREMRDEIFHLVGEHPPALEEDVFRVGGREGHRDQLHARLLGRARGLLVVAAPAGRHDVGPDVLAALSARHIRNKIKCFAITAYSRMTA